jgi:hypothetical protein
MPNPFCEPGYFFDHERCLECPSGEYKGGCVDAGESLITPIYGRTKYPTHWPTSRPSFAPTFNPSIDFCNPRFHLICSFYEHRISLPTVCYACVEAVVNKTLFPSISPTSTLSPSTLSPSPSPLFSPSPSLSLSPSPGSAHSEAAHCSSVCCYGWVIFVGTLGFCLFFSFIIKKCRRRRRPILEDNGVIMVNMSEELEANLPKNDSLRITNVVQS